MSTTSCPSCGAKRDEDLPRCSACGHEFSEGKADGVIDEIDPFYPETAPGEYDIFDDIPPPQKPPEKTPEKQPDTQVVPTPSGSLPAGIPPLAFIGGIILIAILALSVIFILPGLSAPDTPSLPDREALHIEPPGEEEPEPVLEEAKKEPSFMIYDDFSDPASGFGTYESDNFMRYYSRGEYHIIQKGENMSGSALLGGDYTNFFMEVDTRLQGGPLTGRYGLVFRTSDEGRYSFEINGRGWYTVKKRVDGKVYDLIPLTETYILKKGYTVNKLGVMAEGDQLSFFINDSLMRVITDASLTHGDAGFTVSKLAEQGYIGEQGVHVAFDNFRLETV